MSGVIKFYNNNVNFTFPDRIKFKNFIKTIFIIEKQGLSKLVFIFCDDRFLYNLNHQFLKHTTLTDVITFNLSKRIGITDGEIYISIERVKENSKKYKVCFLTELYRIMIHGVLHLCNYSDHNKKEKFKMTTLENHYLLLYGSL